MIELTQIFNQAHRLAPFPVTASRLSALLAQKDLALGDLLEAVSFDQALTAQLLRAANAASDAERSSVRTVADAVAALGMDELVAMATRVTQRSQNQPDASEMEAQERQLWRHSVAAALAVEGLHRFTALEVPREAATAALLHDVGKLALLRFFSQQMGALLQQAETPQALAKLESEVAMLFDHHADLGAVIVRGWGLAPSIARAVQFHLQPPPDDTLCEVVHLAHQVAQVCAPEKGDQPQSSPEAPSRLGVTQQGLLQLCLSVSTRLEQVARRWR